MKAVADHITDILAQASVEGRSLRIRVHTSRGARPLIGVPRERRRGGPRCAGMRTNHRTTPLVLGPLEGRPMSALRLSTIIANIDAKAR